MHRTMFIGLSKNGKKFRPQLFLTLLLAMNLSLQSQQICGSYSLAAVCKDGIVIAADSRGVIFDDETNGNRTYYAFFDSVQKIFVLKNTVVCVTRLLSIQNVFISGFIAEAKRDLPDSLNPYDAIIRLREAVFNKSPKFFESFYDLNIFSAGYVDSEAVMCGKQNRSIECFKGAMVFSNDSLTQFSPYGKYSPDFCIERSCEEIGKLMMQEIIHYSQAIDSITVGGPIYVLKITKEKGIQWLGAYPPQNQFTHTDELFLEHFNLGEKRLKFFSDESKKIFFDRYHDDLQRFKKN